MKTLNDNVFKTLSDLKAILSKYKKDFPNIVLTIEDKIKMLELMIKNKTGVKPFIINAGIYNAGKSLLFNAWAEKTIFPVGDIPTTAKNETYETDEYVLMDTPGIDANREDDEEALSAYKSADIIIEMANIQRGGIDAIEIDYLKKILHWRGSEAAFIESVIFVLSNSDQVNAEEREKVSQKVKDNIKNEMGLEIKEIFCVDSKTFFEGLNNQNDQLINLSNIRQLKSFIENKIRQMGNKFETRYIERLRVVSKELLDEADKLLKLIGNNVAPKNNILEESNKLSGSISEIVEKIKIMKEDFYTNELKMVSNPYPSPWPDFSHGTKSSWYDYRSASSAESAGYSYFRSRYYDRLESKAKAIRNEMRERFNIYLYHEMKDGNFYHSINQKSALLIQNAVNEIFTVIDDQTKVPLTWLNFSVSYQGDPREIIEYLNGSDILDSISLSHFSYDLYTVDISDCQVKESGWFDDGIRYRYEIWRAYLTLEEDVKKAAAEESSSVWRKINSTSAIFIEEVKKELDKRFDHFIKLLETADKENKEKLKNFKAENDSLNKDINELEKILKKLKF